MSGEKFLVQRPLHLFYANAKHFSSHKTPRLGPTQKNKPTTMIVEEEEWIKNWWVNKSVSFLFLLWPVQWRYKMENCRNSWNRRRNSKKTTRTQKKRKWKNRTTLIVFERFEWSQPRNLAIFSSLVADFVLFSIEKKSMEKAVSCVLDCLFCFSSENSANSNFVHG